MGNRVEEWVIYSIFGSHSYCRTNRTTDSVKDLLQEAGKVEPRQMEERNPRKEGLCCSVSGEVRREEMQECGWLSG